MFWSIANFEFHGMLSEICMYYFKQSVLFFEKKSITLRNEPWGTLSLKFDVVNAGFMYDFTRIQLVYLSLYTTCFYLSGWLVGWLNSSAN